MSHNTESDAKFKTKLTLGSKNDFRNFANFYVSSSKSKNLHFNALRLSIAYKVSSKKVQNHALCH